jgi:O-antigen/teichoic acid export membrane protein
VAAPAIPVQDLNAAPTAASADSALALTRRRLGSNTIAYGIGALLNRAASFVMLPIYTRNFLPSDYGLLQLLDMSVEFTAHLVSAGMGSAVLRTYFKTDDPRERSRIATSGWALVILLHLGGMLLLFAAAPFISHTVLRGAGSVGLVRLAALSFAAASLPIIPLIVLQAQQRASLFVTASTGKLLTQLVLNSYFIIVMGWGPRGVILSTLISNLALGVPLSIWLLTRDGRGFSRTLWSELLRFALPLQIGLVAMFIMAFGDRWFLEASHDLVAVGIYGLAYQFGFLLSNLTTAPFLQAWNPQRFQITSLPRAERDETYNEGFWYFNLLLCVGAVGIGLFSRPVLTLVASPAYWGAADLIPLLVLAYMIQAWTNTVHFGIEVSGRTKYSSRANWIATAAILALYALLIPRFGMWGAAIATVLGFLVRFACVYVYAQRLWPVSYRWFPIFRLTLLACLALACGSLLRGSSLLRQVGGSSLILSGFLAVIWTFELGSELRQRVIRLVLSGRRAIPSLQLLR